MTFEELKQQFISNDFQVNENSFVHEMDDPNNMMIINGVPQHNKIRFEMTYVGEGYYIDSDSDSDGEPIYTFDILGPNRETAYTICIESFDDFTKLAR